MLIKLLVNDDMGTFSTLQYLRKDYNNKVSTMDLDKSNEMNKYASVLGSEDDGLFECFE